MMMAWQCTPHSLFCEKRECAVHGGREKTGDAARLGFVDTHVPARGVVRAGVLEVEEWTVLLFPLALPWRLIE